MSKIPLLVFTGIASTQSVIAAGPFIQFQVVHEGYEVTLDRRERITYTAIFDSSIQVPTGSFQTWHDVQSSIERAVYPNSLSFEQANEPIPFSPTVESTLVSLIPQSQFDDLETDLTYDSSNETITLNFSVDDSYQQTMTKHKYRFSIAKPQGFGTTSTLPTDPDLYLPEIIGDPFQINAFFQRFGQDSEHINIPSFIWPDPGIGNTFYSHATFSMKVVDNPNPPQDCLADINNDGRIDFFDISAFIDRYNNGCPELAMP